jgi:hypothetical protein
MWTTFFITAMRFNDSQRFFYCVFVEIIENSINVLAIESSIDHLFLSPRIWNLLYAHGNLHGGDVTDQ